MVLQVTDRQSLSERVMDDPLSEETHKRKRSLIFAASLAIVVSSFDLKAKIPWLGIDGGSSPFVLEGALSVALLYLLASFGINAWEDLRRWLSAASLLHLHDYFDALSRTRDTVENIARNERMSGFNFANLLDEAKEFTRTLEPIVRAARANHRRLSAIQVFKLSTIEVGLPALLALWALGKTADSFFPFVSALF